MKKTLPELKPALNQVPGYALLTLQGWETPAASLDSSYEVCVQRNQDSRFLGADKKWTATQTWHQVDAIESQNEFVALTLGPNVVDPLVQNPQMTYLLQARYGQELAQGVMRIREGVLSSHASGLTGEAVSRIAKPPEVAMPAVATIPEAVPAAATSSMSEPVTQSKNKSSSAMLIAAIVVLLLIAAYFGWRWYKNQQQVVVAPPPAAVVTTPSAPTPPAEPVAEPPVAPKPPAEPVAEPPVAPKPPAEPVAEPPVAPPPPEPVAAPPVASPPPPPPEPAPAPTIPMTLPPPTTSAAACSSEALAATKNDLSFIQACLRTTPDTGKVLAVIESAKTAKRCDVAHRLYAFKGQAGDVVIALAYAKEFDPKFFTAGCVTAADKNTALYWYDLVLARDANHAEAKERAEALRK